MAQQTMQPKQDTQDQEAGLRQVRFTDKERGYAYAVAMRYVKHEEDARDVAQDAMLLAFLHQQRFRGDAKFTTWLYRITATTALMHLRRQRRAPQAMLPDDRDGHAPGASAAGPSPEEYSASAETLEQCQRHLARMGDKYRKIFRLRFLDGYSESEIAQQLGLTVGAVKTRAFRVRAHLRQCL